MATTAAPAPTSAEPLLNKPELQKRINALRHINNWTNWKYIAFEYLLMGSIIGAMVWFDSMWPVWGISRLWCIPVALVGIFLMGMAQHRLSMIAHEASHWLLFHNQKLNDFVSNITCLYPMLSTTFNYRLQHMAHHQFVNDPVKDPDLAYMIVVGARYHHPMGTWRFWREIVLRLLFWVPSQLQYIMIRAKMSALGAPAGPYAATRKQSKWLTLLGPSFMVVLLGVLTVGVMQQNYWLLSAVPAAMALAMAGITACLPEHWYMKTLIKPVLPLRWDLYGRSLYHTLLFTGLAWLTLLTGQPWWAYYFIFWLTPLGTILSFFMMVREEVQHTNAGQEKFKHTRNFVGNPVVKFTVFPWNMDFHLEHHLYQMVPHFELPKLRRMLCEDPAYRDITTVVEGYLLPHK